MTVLYGFNYDKDPTVLDFVQTLYNKASQKFKIYIWTKGCNKGINITDAL